MASGIPAGKAFIEFVLNDKRLDSGLANVGAKFRKFGTFGLAATAPIIAGFTAAIKTFTDTGSQLDDMSQRTGLSAQSLSELAFAAEQSGTSLEVVEKAAAELQKKGIDPNRFDEIADGIAAIEDPTKRAQAAMEAFGKRSGRELLPLLADLPKLRQQARDLGVVMSSEDAAAAAKLGDTLDVLWTQIKAVAIQVGAAVAGPFTNFLTVSQQILTPVIAFIRENPNFVAAVAAITLGIAAASAAAVTFGIVLGVLTAHPFIAAAAVIAGLVLGIATYFGLASSGAKDFRKELDKVKPPAGADTALQAQAAQVQRSLKGSLRTQVPVASAARRESRTIGGVDEVIRWTRETAEGVDRLATLLTQTGLVAGTA